MYGLTVHQDSLVATGTFGQSPGQTTDLGYGIARWDGVTWRGYGAGARSNIGGTVLGATSFNGQLYVYGSLYELNHVPVKGVGRWTGTTFEQVGASLLGSVYGLREFQGRLVAFGINLQYASVPLAGAMAWDGQSWQQLGGGITDITSSGDQPWSLEELNGQLFVAGDMGTAGGMPSKWLARWADPIAPTITANPVATSSCNHRAVELRVVASGTQLGYRWAKNGVPLDLTEYPSAGSATLAIASPRQGDAGGYACRVFNQCGSVVSDTALVSVCEADFNCDASLDFFDYLDFVQAFAAGTGAADFNADGVVDFFDYLDFVGALATGC
jgi:hypothetical protein